MSITSAQNDITTDGFWAPGRDAASYATDTVLPDLTGGSGSFYFFSSGAGATVQQASILPGDTAWKSLVKTDAALWAKSGDNYDYAGTQAHFRRIVFRLSAAQLTAMRTGYARFWNKQPLSDNGECLFVAASNASVNPGCLNFERKVAGVPHIATWTTPLVADTLYDVWCVYDPTATGQQMRLYVNGALVATAASTLSLPGNAADMNWTGCGSFALVAVGPVAPTLSQIQAANTALTTIPVTPAAASLVVQDTAVFGAGAGVPKGDADPPSLEIVVASSDPDVVLPWTASIAAGPITVANTAGTTDPDERGKPAAVVLNADISGLDVGSLVRTLTVESRVGMTPEATASILWKADAELPMAQEWASSSSLPNVAAPPAPAANRIWQDSTFKAVGTKSYAFSLPAGDDVPGAAHRAELGQALPPNGPTVPAGAKWFYDGDERWIALQYYIPATFPNENLFANIFQIKPVSPGGGGPNLGFDVGEKFGGGVPYLKFYGNTNVWGSTAGTIWGGNGPLGPVGLGGHAVPYGVWSKFVIHVKFSADPAIGYYEIFGDLGDGQGMRTLAPKKFTATMKYSSVGVTDPSHLRVGIYADPTTVGNANLWVDGVTVATTRAGAEANAFLGGHHPGSPQTVAVTLPIVAGGKLAANLTKIRVTGTAGSPEILHASLVLSSPTGATVNYKIVEGVAGAESEVPWLAVVPATGTVTGSGTVTHDVQLTAAGLQKLLYGAGLGVVELTGSPNTDPTDPVPGFLATTVNGVQQLRWGPVPATVNSFVIAWLRPGQTTVPSGQYQVISPPFDVFANQYVYVPNETDGTGPFPGETVRYGICNNIIGAEWVADNARPQIAWPSTPVGGGSGGTGAPAITNLQAVNVTGTGVTLKGTVDPKGLSASLEFEYGLTTAYGAKAAATPETTNVTAIPQLALTGLAAGQTYNYRLVATSSAGVSRSGNGTFTTTSPAPPPLPPGTRPQLLGVCNQGYSAAQVKAETGSNVIRSPDYDGSAAMTTTIDNLIKDCAAQKMFVFVLVNFAHQMDSGFDQTKLNNAMKTAVGRWGPGASWLAQNGISDYYAHGFEVLNEPYLHPVGKAGAPMKYAQICKSAISAGRTVNSQARFGVCMNSYPHYNPNDGAGWRDWNTDMMVGSGGVPDLISAYADFMVIHFYGEPYQGKDLNPLSRLDTSLDNYYKKWIDQHRGSRTVKAFLTELNRSDQPGQAQDEAGFVSAIPEFIKIVKARSSWIDALTIFSMRDYAGLSGRILGYHDINGNLRVARSNAAKAAKLSSTNGKAIVYGP